MRTSHAELVERKFMVKLSDLSEDNQQTIASSLIHHNHPWRMVVKEDSISTPIRLVVDPTKIRGAR